MTNLYTGVEQGAGHVTSGGAMHLINRVAPKKGAGHVAPKQGGACSPKQLMNKATFIGDYSITLNIIDE